MCSPGTCWSGCSLHTQLSHSCSSRIALSIIHQQHSHPILQMTLSGFLCCVLCRLTRVFPLHWVLLSPRALQWSVWQLQVTGPCSPVLCTEQREWWWWWWRWSEWQRSSLCEAASLAGNSRGESWGHEWQCQEFHYLVMIHMRAFLCLCNLSTCTHLALRVVDDTWTSSVPLHGVQNK